MRCKTVQKNMTAFLDRELSKRLSDEIADHVHSCPACEKTARDMKTACELMAAMEPSPSASTLSAEEILRLARRPGGGAKEKKRRKRTIFPGQGPLWIPTLAVITVCSVIIIWQITRHMDIVSPPAPQEIFVAERMELFENLGLIENLDLLEFVTTGVEENRDAG